MFSFSWKSECFNSNPLSAGENITSPIFYVEPSKTFEFCLELYPRGCDTSDTSLRKKPAYASLILLRRDENPRNIRLKGFVSANYKGINTNSQQFDCVLKKGRKQIFEFWDSSKLTSLSLHRKQTFKFWESSEVTSLLLSDRLYDEIDIHCKIVDVEIDEFPCCNEYDLEALSSAYSELIKDGLFTDEKFNVGCEELFIHKAILAARCVGETFKEKVKNWKYLWSFISSKAGSSSCRTLIEFLYSGKLDYSNVTDELCIALKKVDSFLLKRFETHTTSMDAVTLFTKKDISFTWSIENVSDFSSKEKIFTITEGSTWGWIKCVLKAATSNAEDGFVLTIHRLDCTTNLFLRCTVWLYENGHPAKDIVHQRLFLSKDDFKTTIYLKMNHIHQQKDKLISNLSMKLDILIYLCKNENATKITHTSVSQSVIVTDFTKLKNLHDLADDAKLLFENRCLPDVTLEVDGKKFHAHKAILSARSLEFNYMFKLDTKKKYCKKIPIEGIKPNVFSSLLSYIYCAHVDKLDFEIAFDLYEAANRFKVQPLKLKCSEFLKCELSVGNVELILGFAEMWRDYGLRQSCCEFMSVNSEKMQQYNRLVKGFEDQRNLCTKGLDKLLNFCQKTTKNLTEMN